MRVLKQSTAATVKVGPFLDSGDGDTVEGSLTISQADIRLSKNGGNYAQKNESSAATHDELGYYDVDLDTTDTGTLGHLRVAVHESGALSVWEDFWVWPANVYDSLFGGSDYLDVNTVQVEGSDATDQINAAADTALTDYDAPTYDELLAFVQLLARKDAAIASDRSTELSAINTDEGSGAGAFSNAAEALEAIRDRGDAAWALTAAQVNAACDTAIEDAALATAAQLTAATTSGAVSTNMTAVEFRVDDTFEQRFVLNQDISARDNFYVMVKANTTPIPDDDDALIAWTAGTGLTRLNGASTTAGYGGITINDAETGDFTLTLGTTAAAALVANSDLIIGAKCVYTDGTAVTVGTGTASIEQSYIEATT